MTKAVQLALVITGAWFVYIVHHLTSLNIKVVWAQYHTEILMYFVSFFVSALGVCVLLSEIIPARSGRKLASLKRQFEDGKLEVKREVSR